MTSSPPFGPTGDNPDVHLERLLAGDVEEPWYRSLIKNVKELINPPKLPPLEVTSTPVPVQDIWGAYSGKEKQSGLMSLAIHVSVVALIFILGTNKQVQDAVKEKITLIAPDLSPYKPAPPKQKAMGG